MRRRLADHPAVAPAVMVSLIAATLLPLCGAIFSCGCDLLHGAGRCNIHHAAGPHCPWCSHGGAAFVIDFAIIAILVAGGMTLARRRWGTGLGLALVVGGSVYLASAGAVGWVTAHVMGYPLRW